MSDAWFMNAGRNHHEIMKRQPSCLRPVCCLCVQVEIGGLSNMIVEAHVPVLRNSGQGFLRLQKGAFSSNRESLQLYLEVRSATSVHPPSDPPSSTTTVPPACAHTCSYDSTPS
eukprot:2508886-Pyramimonas_sp.AAC.1